MNERQDILDAWIRIEQLVEGSIKKSDKNLRTFDSNEEAFDKLFFDFLIQQKDKRRMKDQAFKKSGLVFYFDIFDFQEIVDILRRKYKINSDDYEETAKTDKFTFALYFDHQLKFIPDKFFFTISGYIRYKGDFPKNFAESEKLLKDDLEKKFEDNEFNAVFQKLFEQYKVDVRNCRVGFINNLENEVKLHSFFIEDLKRAKKVSTENLNRYFKGFLGERHNLDSNKNSCFFNSSLLKEILQPKFYPLGRFPSNLDHSLSFMQQVTVNLALNEENKMRGVNGPPGTGKTTLLKDIFADLIVQQANEICYLSNKKINGTLNYFKKARFGFLPSRISEKNIIVASANNGAVQNIVNELPQIKGIAEEFRNEILKVDYFTTISNAELVGKWKKNEKESFRELTVTPTTSKNWGIFSLEGGKSDNISRLLLTIECIIDYLKTEYNPNSKVYNEFLALQEQVLNEQKQAQEYFEQLEKLSNLESEFLLKTTAFSEEMTRRLNELNQELKNKQNQIIDIKNEVVTLEENLACNDEWIKVLTSFEIDMQESLNELLNTKPSFLWLKKFFNNEKAKNYTKTVEDAQNRYSEIKVQKEVLEVEKRKNFYKIDWFRGKQKQLQDEIQNIKSNFETCQSAGEKNIAKLKNKIESLQEALSQTTFNKLDFSVSYEELQKSNPWFTKEFRIKQTELFIKALEVRKQFLFDNKKNLNAAKMIWEKQAEYLAKENGSEMVCEAWQWINFTIPVISTTFASFGRMFSALRENSLGKLFIDEAGQASPQASVGAIFRSKEVMVVGDPSQIKPVLSIDSAMLNLIAKNYEVDETFISTNASTQTIVDGASQYGFQKEENEWIGVPLWVHRRSKDPMFTISNEISYNGLMVQGKSLVESQGIAQWIDVPGKASDKFVKEQAIELRERIQERIKENSVSMDDIYVISPFKNVAYQIARELDIIGFTKRKNGKPTNVGTVHTFQGKEAKIVYFVLGADSNSKGAAIWAVSEPNLMNVAATRAKEEFYILGDKALYSSLGSKVANKTITIINRYTEEALT